MGEAEPYRSFTRRTRALLEEGEEARIVLFGDSITAGFAVRRGFDHFWLSMLKETYPKAAVAMRNQGACGATSFDGLARLDWSVVAHNPDLVTVNFGINDMYSGIRLGEFKGNLIAIVERIAMTTTTTINSVSVKPLNFCINNIHSSAIQPIDAHAKARH